MTSSCGVANAPGRPALLVPALRIAHEPVEPALAPLVVARSPDREALGVDAVGERGARWPGRARAAARPRRADGGRSRSSRRRGAPPRPCARPTSARAAPGRHPAASRAIASSILSSVPCRCVTIGTPAHGRRGGLVQRCQVVQVEDLARDGVRPIRRSGAPTLRPSARPAAARPSGTTDPGRPRAPRRTGASGTAHPSDPLRASSAPPRRRRRPAPCRRRRRRSAALPCAPSAPSDPHASVTCHPCATSARDR